MSVADYRQKEEEQVCPYFKYPKHQNLISRVVVVSAPYITKKLNHPIFNSKQSLQKDLVKYYLYRNNWSNKILKKYLNSFKKVIFQPISYSSPRGGISQVTEKGEVNTLILF